MCKTLFINIVSLLSGMTGDGTVLMINPQISVYYNKKTECALFQFKAANSKFYKKEADGTLGPAIKAVYKSSSMMKSFGKKTTSDVAGDYMYVKF